MLKCVASIIQTKVLMNVRVVNLHFKQMQASVTVCMSKTYTVVY